MTSNRLRHVGIIMDGNNRWAKQRKLPGVAGHKAGVERIRDVMRACQKEGVEVLTLFAFSSENWQRPAKEVEALMSLFQLYLQREARKLHDEGVRLQVIGRRDRFGPKILNAIEDAETLTSAGTTRLVIAADYGGQWDIANAARAVAVQVAAGELQPADIDDQCLHAHTQLADLPALDLLIRTGGEYRISNFLLWQAAYAELYFSEQFWPDFDDQSLHLAAQDFYGRQRRFGLNGDQVEEAVRA
ncbi:polyprenyl diphosphate synthase [Simiduia aestuariiviva]|uniref:Ditrans,polycis-undecaprenyl-diphosphate synthase ((2E,6E)-farnesyl-diphosphate specific) n=1 Tax=Simiduia aestuariiviva TaxID=1510459 RepID=A0A839UM48_9GAMM|nr:undecaprenyl diphosphate synthase [Simiduia aestuariiviva]